MNYSIYFTEIKISFFSETSILTQYVVDFGKKNYEIVALISKLALPLRH